MRSPNSEPWKKTIARTKPKKPRNIAAAIFGGGEGNRPSIQCEVWLFSIVERYPRAGYHSSPLLRGFLAIVDQQVLARVTRRGFYLWHFLYLALTDLNPLVRKPTP